MTTTPTAEDYEAARQALAGMRVGPDVTIEQIVNMVWPIAEKAGREAGYAEGYHQGRHDTLMDAANPTNL